MRTHRNVKQILVINQWFGASVTQTIQAVFRVYLNIGFSDCDTGIVIPENPLELVITFLAVASHVVLCAICYFGHGDDKPLDSSTFKCKDPKSYLLTLHKT